MIKNEEKAEVFLKQDQIQAVIATDSVKFKSLKKSTEGVGTRTPDLEFSTPPIESFYDHLRVTKEKLVLEKGPKFDFTIDYTTRTDVLGSVLSWLLFPAILIIFWIIMMRRMSGGGGGGGRGYGGGGGGGGGYGGEQRQSIPPLMTEKIMADRKQFFLDLKENARGRVVKITEDVNGRRDTIMVPMDCLQDFYEAIGRLLESAAAVFLENEDAILKGEFDDELLEQLRSLPVSGEADPDGDLPGDGGKDDPGLWPGPAGARLAARLPPRGGGRHGPARKGAGRADRRGGRKGCNLPSGIPLASGC